MSPTEIRNDIKRAVDELSDRRLLVAADFLRYLRDLECEEATTELLSDPGLAERVRAAERAIDAGETVSWREVRDDV